MANKENTKGLDENEELEDEEDQNDNSGTVGGGADDDNGSDSKDNKGNGGKKEGRSFSQEQVNRMMTREKKQGRAAAYKELGIDPKDTKMVKMFQAFVNSQKTDEQKAAERDAEILAKQSEAERRAVMAEAKAEAMMLGIKSQYVEDAVTLAMSKVSDDTDLKTILNELKEKYNLWFEPGEDSDEDEGNEKPEKKVGQKGTGATIKEVTKKGSKKESIGMGARLAAQRKMSSKTSYWGGNR